MGHAHEMGVGCGRRFHAITAGVGRLGGREPFAFPGTKRRYAPDRTVDITHTKLEIAFDPEVVSIEGTATHDFEALADGTTDVHIHAGELSIDAVTDETGRELPFRHVGEDVHIELPTPLDFGEPGTVAVRYRGTPRRGIYFIRPDHGYPSKPHQVWTQGQDEDSRYWFPCFDHPTEKFSSEVLATVPAKYTAISNGALLGKTEHDDGTVTWHWSQEGEHSAYLVTLAVGEFDEIHLGDEPVPMNAYVPVGMREVAERAFGRTAQMVEVLSRRFGVDYPWEKYAQVVVEDFIFGGMENTSATTLIDIVLYDDRAALDFDLDDLVVHELAHQWWGDLLTCREWPHAWLNEGFATWTEILWKEEGESEDEAAYERFTKAATYRQEDGSEYRRPIVDRRFVEPIDLFDRHLYQKGGLVLHMLRKELGESAFWRSITAYAERNRGASVVTEDLRVAIEAATGRNLDWFLDQWVYHAGHPELEISWTWDKDASALRVTVKQTQDATDEMVELFRMGVDVRAVSDEGVETLRRFQITDREHTFTLPADAEPASVEVDPAGDLLAVMDVKQPAAASRATLAGDGPLLGRIRAAKLLEDEPTRENVAALVAVIPEAFWGLAVEAAGVLGSMRTPAARDALLDVLPRTGHPKARQGVIKALGSFRGDERVGDALKVLLKKGDPSMFVEAAAATALGKVRASGAREVLEAALETKDAWAEVIRIGIVNGLAALGDEAVVPAVTACCAYGRHMRLRAAAIKALGSLGARMKRREGILDTLADVAVETDLRIVISVAAALRTMGDPAGIAILEDAPARHPDGRVRREAKAAVLRLRKSGGDHTETATLSDELEKLRGAHAELLQRVEKLEGLGALEGDGESADDGQP